MHKCRQTDIQTSRQTSLAVKRPSNQNNVVVVCSKYKPCLVLTNVVRLLFFPIWSSACAPGTWGKNCNISCGFCESGLCNNRDGKCEKCATGYQGELCNGRRIVVL